MTRWTIFCLVALSGSLAHAAAEGQRVEVSRDVWLSSFPTEREGNNGASPRLKLKGIQEFFLIDFDPAPWRGRRVVRAQLHLHAESPEVLGRVTVSSLTAAWVEGRGAGYAKTPGASSFLAARNGAQPWADGAPDITGVILGLGGSIWGFGDATPRDSAGWQIVPIAPDVVQARLDGRSEGFCVIDDVGNEYSRQGNTINYRPFPNRYFTSREGPRAMAPYFTLWLDDGPVPAATIANSPTPPTSPGQLPPIPPRLAGSTVAPSLPCRDQFGAPLESLELFAARNETIGFIVKAPAAVATVPGLTVRTFSLPLVGGHEDPLLPWPTPAPAPEIVADSGQSFVEIHVPRTAAAGRHEGTLLAGDRRLSFAVTVWNFSLPDRLSFVPQMNAYSLPGAERDYYRLAHEHRTVLNRLAYGWTGRVDRGCAPEKRPDGTWDWAAWDARFGPLFDGAAFRDLPRAGVPVEAFYLPLNENWPMDHERHFRGGYWIETAYPEEYWREFRAAATEFAAHFATKQWTEPVFEFYLNNKVYFKRDRGNRWDACSAPWIFDEPVNTQDFWALRRFGLEFWRGVNAQPGARFSFRADISRPEWQRDLLDGVSSTEIVSGALRPYRDRVVARAARHGNAVAMYGSANRIGTPNFMPAAWCVETWALGADGVVPWQTIGKPTAWKTPDHLSLFYPSATGPVPSLRLKSFRAGQQLTEYLTMYTVLSGQSRAAVGAAVLAEPGLHSALEKASEADAGTLRYGPAAHRTLMTLRQRLGHWLDTQAPADRDRWHDPRPLPHDPAAVRAIQALAIP